MKNTQVGHGCRVQNWQDRLQRARWWPVGVWVHNGDLLPELWSRTWSSSSHFSVQGWEIRNHVGDRNECKVCLLEAVSFVLLSAPDASFKHSIAFLTVLISLINYRIKAHAVAYPMWCHFSTEHVSITAALVCCGSSGVQIQVDSRVQHIKLLDWEPQNKMSTGSPYRDPLDARCHYVQHWVVA